MTVRRVSTDETERKEGQRGGRIGRKEKEPPKQEEERIEAVVESFGRRGRLDRYTHTLSLSLPFSLSLLPSLSPSLSLLVQHWLELWTMMRQRDRVDCRPAARPVGIRWYPCAWPELIRSAPG